MIKIPKLSKVFFGWWTVLACGIIALLGGGFVWEGFSVLFKPIASELGLSRAATSTAASVQNLMSGALGPIGGWASDRYGPNWVILFGVFCLAFGCILMYFIDSLWAFLLVWGIVIGAGSFLACTIATDKAIVNWFVKKSGIAINAKFVISSFSGLLVLPLIAWLTLNQGWRVTSIVAGVIIALVGFPLAYFLIKPHRPEYYGLLPDGEIRKEGSANTNQTVDLSLNNTDKAEVVEFTLIQSLKTPTYWVMIVRDYIAGLAMPIMSIHCIPFLTDMGIDPVKAAGMMAFLITCSIPARLVTGFFVDRVDTKHLRFIMMVGYLLQAAGVTVFLVNKSVVMIFVWFLLYSSGQAASFGVHLPMVARYYGRKAYGSILGSRGVLGLPIALVAPVYCGWVYDTTGSYMTVFLFLALSLFVSGVLAFFILPPKPPIRVLDTRIA